MAITRTPIIDDDGSGTTGTVLDNAWKQELYNQIDAMGAPAAVYGTFTFTDGSGAGLALVFAQAAYYRVGRFVLVQSQVVYPGTANGNAAVLTGLPIAASAFAVGGGFFHGYGAPMARMFVPPSGNQVQFLNPTTGVGLTNAALTGANITIHGMYLVD